MKTEQANGASRHLGAKVRYSFVMAMSVIIIAVNGAGILGVWAVRQPLNQLAITTLEFVADSAAVIRTYTARVDQSLEQLQTRATAISSAAGMLSRNVTDKGLVLVLLPDERTQELAATAASVRDTFDGVRESVTRGIALYRAIDRLPLISLPRVDQDPVESLAASVDETEQGVQSLRDRVDEFRSGTAEKIDVVEEAATALDERIQRARDRVAVVDGKMSALESGAIALQRKIAIALTTTSVILTLFLAFVIWTQVMIIRQYSARWRLLGKEEAVAGLPEPESRIAVPGQGSGVQSKPATKMAQPSRKRAGSPTKKRRTTAKK